MATKVRPVPPPKPARLSMSSQKRISEISSSTRSSTITVTDIPLSESPPPELSEESFNIDDRTPRASEIFLPSPEGRQARALYDFVGEVSYNELSFKAGDTICILKEQLSEGWSLAEKDGITGLVPESYITYTTEFTEVLNSEVLSSSLSSHSDRDSINIGGNNHHSKNESITGSIYGSLSGY
ncbi:20244_t:CDS:2, partial [Dentiscutata erythropus]